MRDQNHPRQSHSAGEISTAKEGSPGSTGGAVGIVHNAIASSASQKADAVSVRKPAQECGARRGQGARLRGEESVRLRRAAGSRERTQSRRDCRFQFAAAAWKDTPDKKAGEL